MPLHRFLLTENSKPGLQSQCAERVDACVAYTPEMVVLENDYHARGVIAVMICKDPW
jgi:hypothetical protein